MGVIVYGPHHIKSTQGILKVIEFLVSTIGLILVAIDGFTAHLIRAQIVGFAVVMVISLLILVLHITKLGKPIHKVLAFQLYWNLIWFVYLLIVSAIYLSKYSSNRCLAGGSFGIIASILYLADAVDCYRIDPSPVYCINV